MNFDEKLIKLRKEKGISQEELGEALNVTRQTVSKWELGQSRPDMDKLIEIGKYFNVDLNYLTDDTKKSAIEKENINQKNTNEEPRKWLMVVLILIAIAIIIVLVNKVIQDKKESQDNKNNIFQNIISSITNSISDSEDNINNVLNNENTSKAVFNSKFVNYSGTEMGVYVLDLLDNVISSNEQNTEHIVYIEYKGNKTCEKDEIVNIKSSLDTFTEYEVSIGYDDEGYVNSVSFYKALSKKNIDAFNREFEFYSGTKWKTNIESLFSKIVTNNKKNKDNVITVVYGKTKGSDEATIKKIKKSLKDFTDYDVSLDYNKDGYVCKVKISK